MKLFLSSFLVLFLEIALIRWMPAYIRLLAYFSNFILLASFLGCGLGCMLVRTRRRLFMLFPLIQLGSLVVVGAFAVMSWLQVPPVAWFAVAFATALPFLVERRGAVAMINVGLLAGALGLVWKMEGASLWSPYYRIDVVENGSET